MQCGGIKKVISAYFVITTVFVAGFLNTPILRAHAEERLDIDVNIVPQLSLTTSTDTLELEASAEPNGAFTSGNVTAIVSTNNAAGYTLTMSAKGTNAALENTLNGNKKIPSDFTGPVTYLTMAVNKWGYSVDNIDYYAVPIASSPATLKNVTTAVDNDASTVYYGVKINNEIETGVYEKNVVFTAYINSDYVVPERRTIFDIRKMQEMTSIACANTTTPATDAAAPTWVKSEDTSLVPRTILTDERDGTSYLVSKLADGKCWMSQNLEFELDTDPLADTDTDLNTKSTWTATNYTRSYEDFEPISGASWNVDKSVRPASDQRFLRGGTTAASTATGAGINYYWERTGYYYNWIAATAGSDINDQTSGNSICPKGWKLPSSTDFSNLVNTIYNINNSQPGYHDVQAFPLNMTYSGRINDWSSNRAISDLGYDSAYWLSDGQVYGVNTNWDIPGTEGWYKDNGATVRCVAR